jgi:hypothetical protein
MERRCATKFTEAWKQDDLLRLEYIAGPLCRPSEGVVTLLARTSAAANENRTSEAIDGVLIEEWLESLWNSCRWNSAVLKYGSTERRCRCLSFLCREVPRKRSVWMIYVWQRLVTPLPSCGHFNRKFVKRLDQPRWRQRRKGEDEKLLAA